MAAGSFGYLYTVYGLNGLDGIISHSEEIKEMATSLLEMGYDDIASDTESALELATVMDDILRLVIGRLEPVWEAVEFNHSGDWGRERVEEIVEKYRSRKHS